VSLPSLFQLLKTSTYLYPIFTPNPLTFCIKILDFGQFRSDILTPNSYVDLAKDLYDDGGEDDCPSYMAIYETVHEMCKEQHSIIEKGADLILSSIFRALPLLKEVRMSFCQTLEECDWVLQSLIPDMIMEEDFYKHHLKSSRLQ
jgi:hypothetical protein